jgi:hypothetical protein
MLPEEALDHVAFAAANLDAVAAVLKAAGAIEARRAADSVYFRADGGLLVEITRDPDLPDTLWCPMHPNVRAPAAGKCPICAMDLVPIPPPRIGQYRLDVSAAAAAGGKGTSALTFRIRDPQSGEPVTSFVSLHERLFHLFVISRDLRFFAHEHPEQRDDRFELPIDLAPGSYMLLADFMPAGGAPQMVHRAHVTPGAPASPFALPPVEVAEDLTDKVIDGMRVQLAVDSRRDRPEAVLRFRFTSARDGTPIGDLQPYLGVSGHLLIVSTDLTHAVHAHPEGLTSGPDINFGAEFPLPGLYKVWVQVQRQERVFTAPFVLRVGAPQAAERLPSGELERQRTAARRVDFEAAPGGQFEGRVQPVGLGELRLESANPREDFAAPAGQQRNEPGRGVLRKPRSDRQQPARRQGLVPARHLDLAARLTPGGSCRRIDLRRLGSADRSTVDPRDDHRDFEGGERRVVFELAVAARRVPLGHAPGQHLFPDRPRPGPRVLVGHQ